MALQPVDRPYRELPALVAVKLAMIGLLILFASPTATHALAKAALGSGLKPKLAEPSCAEEVTPSKP